MGTESGREMALLGHGMAVTHVPASLSEGQLSWEQRGCLGQVGCPPSVPSALCLLGCGRSQLSVNRCAGSSHIGVLSFLQL